VHYRIVVVVIYRIDKTQDNPNTQKYIKDREQLTSSRLRTKITVADCCECYDAEVKAIDPFPTFQVVINSGSESYRNDGCD
jgi:hypothetical protein